MRFKYFAITGLIMTGLLSCGSNTTPAKAEKAPEKQLSIAFDADSAYQFVAEQVELGPRVPGSPAHELCAGYINHKLTEYGAEINVTDTIVKNVENKDVRVRNIFGRFNLEAPTRVLLAAHYDTRPWADKDPDPANHDKPIDGANDGASGVGVLLEIARNINQFSPNIGIDMLFVDAEDSGSYGGHEATWCVGSQLWASQIHPYRSRIRYGILLDMVGARDARFHREYFSEMYARTINNLVWQAADRTGHSDRFDNSIGGPLNDDHIYLMQAGFPVIDIVECNNPETGSFNPTWHTMQDNLDNIDRATLKAVGEVVIATIKN